MNIALQHSARARRSALHCNRPFAVSGYFTVITTLSHVALMPALIRLLCSSATAVTVELQHMSKDWRVVTA